MNLPSASGFVFGAGEMRPGRAVYAAAVLAPIAYGLLSVWMGQDANWDLRNYHFYNAYAFLHGRLGFDMAVAHHATFYNPLPDLPFYALVTTLPPRLTGFVMGAIQGLNYPLVMAIAWRLLAIARPAVRDGAAIAVAALGMLGAGTLSEIGTTFQDNMISLFVLGALAGLVLNYRQLVESPLKRALGIAAAMGLLCGLGVGLKQTAAIYALGICVALLLVTTDWQRRFLLAYVFGLGAIAGMAITGGFWMWTLWREYGNPLFPYYNHIFKSPWALDADYINREFLPKSFWEALVYPFVFATDPFRVGEIPFRGLRIPLLYALAILTVLAWPLRALWAGPGALRLCDRYPSTFVIAAATVAYLAWLRTFGVYRYLVPLEMLAPLLILLLVDRLALPRWAHGALLGGVMAAVLATGQPGNWGRASWADDYFGVKAPPIPEPKNSMVVMTGTEPLAYAIPFFPPQVPFIRIEGWFTGPGAKESRYDREMRRRIAAHFGPLYVFFRARYEHERTVKALAAYGLKLRDGACVTFKPHIDIVVNEVLAFCPLDRL